MTTPRLHALRTLVERRSAAGGRSLPSSQRRFGRRPSSFCALMNHWISLGTQAFSSSSIAHDMRLIRRSWSSESRIWKPAEDPLRASGAATADARFRETCRPTSARRHAEQRLDARHASRRAALFVNVTASMPAARRRSSRMTQAMRCTSTRVLPLPAPASTSVGRPAP